MASVGVRLGLRGAPGVGKTTVVERLIARLHESGVRVGGFVTREVRDGQRVGFACHDLAGGSAVIAHVGWDSGPKVGRYRVDVAAFESVAVPALDRGAVGNRQVVVIDEVGAMELLSGPFIGRLWRLFDQRVSVVVTMHSRPHPVTDQLATRSDVQLLEVTLANRDSLPGLLHQRLRGLGHGTVV